MSINKEPEARGSNYYHDQGCRVAPSCLKCPLSVCVDDVPGGINGKAYRFLKIRTFYDENIVSIEAVAEEFAIGIRTVLRALRPEARAILSWRQDIDRDDL